MKSENFMGKLLNGVEVEWKALGEIITSNTGGGTPSKAKPDYWSGDIPWASVGDLSIESHFIEKTRNHITAEGLKNSSSNLISKGDLIVAVKISPGKMKIAGVDLAINQDLRGLKLKDEISVKFIYYYFQTLTFQGNGTIVKAITSKDIEKIQIPIPCPENPKKSLAIQAEIVRILDAFTSLTAELTAELTARKRQYNYYRDHLLSFEEGEVEWKTLGELGENLDSKRKPITGSLRDPGDIPYYGASGIVDYVKDYIFDGDFLLISEDGANLLARNTPIAFSISGKSWVNNHAHVLKFETYVERKYVEYYLNSIDLTPHISGAAQPKLNKKNLESISIPNPSPQEKERIVAILDKFESLANSVNEGLPREIELRQKQYEYYRNLLLSFPKPDEVAA